MVETQGQQVPVFQLVIQFNPSNGALALSLPQTDPMMQLAMLEMAKLQVTINAVAQNFGIEKSAIVKVPPGAKIQA